MSFSSKHDVFESTDCDLITYLATRVGVSEVEALERLGDCLLEQSPQLRPWSDLDMQVLTTSMQQSCDNAL
jgi:hypothetical protein